MIEAPEAPESAIAGLEPLLDIPQFCEWAQVSIWFVKHYSKRKSDPFPVIGTARNKRIVPSEAIEWMRRNKDVVDE